MGRIINKGATIEGPLELQRINEIPNCPEKEKLLQVREMLIKLNLEPADYIVKEYPIKGAYVCFNADKDQNFTNSETINGFRKRKKA